MGTGWAVGAAATLGLSAAILLADPSATLQPGLLLFVVPFVLGAWAYAVSMASHGSRGALVALAVHAAVAGVLLAGVRLAACAPGLACPPQEIALQGVTLVVGALAAFAALGELRRRKGPVQGRDAALLLAPLALALLLRLAAALA